MGHEKPEYHRLNAEKEKEKYADNKILLRSKHASAVSIQYKTKVWANITNATNNAPRTVDSVKKERKKGLSLNVLMSSRRENRKR